jgi:elongation factor Ts
MTEISLDEVKRLRELTGVGITDAKQALVEAGGDFDKALAAMRKKGLTKAEKRSEREARAGLIGSYVHDGRIGVLVEVNCETDFVAKTDEFKELVKDISLHIAASAPEFTSVDEVPAQARKASEDEFTEKARTEGKPDNMVPQIVGGMVKKHFADKALLEQAFVKNPEITVGDYIKEHIAKLGENIVVRRFTRMVLGEVG